MSIFAQDWFKDTLVPLHYLSMCYSFCSEYSPDGLIQFFIRWGKLAGQYDIRFGSRMKNRCSYKYLVPLSLIVNKSHHTTINSFYFSLYYFKINCFNLGVNRPFVSNRAVTITALPLHRGNEMPTAVLRSSPHHRTFFRETRADFLQRGNKTR